MAPEFIGDRSSTIVARLEARFCRAIADIATLSGGFLASSDAPLMALAVPSDGWGDAAPLLVWDQRLAPRDDIGRDLCAATLFGPALDALCLAADDLFDILEDARICPAGATGISVITDGTGVALTAEIPDAATADARWLLALAGREGRAATVLPMASDGIWGLLTLQSDTASIH